MDVERFAEKLKDAEDPVGLDLADEVAVERFAASTMTVIVSACDASMSNKVLRKSRNSADVVPDYAESRSEREGELR